MPVEINLGERFGKLIIKHEKSLPKLLEDLTKDSPRIQGAIEKLHHFPNTVKKAKGAVPERLVIMTWREPWAERQLAGYSSIVHEFSACAGGTLVEQVIKRPLKQKPINMIGLGRTNLEDETRIVNPRFLPEWLSRPENAAELREAIKNFFYPSSV